MNITSENNLKYVTEQDVTLEVELLSLATELALITYGEEFEQEQVEYFKHIIKKHSK